MLLMQSTIVFGATATGCKAIIIIKCTSGDHWNTKKEWSILDTTKGARTISEIQSLSKQSAKKNFGCLKIPIILFNIS